MHQLESKLTVQDSELKSFRKNLSEAIKPAQTSHYKSSATLEPQKDNERIKKLKIVKSGLKDSQS